MWDLIVSVPDHCLSFYFPPIGSGDRVQTMNNQDANADGIRTKALFLPSPSIVGTK